MLPAIFGPWGWVSRRWIFFPSSRESRVLELPEACCGLAGTYGMKKENFAIAEEVGRELFQAVKERKAKVVLSDCEACRMQIAFHTGVKTLHPIQVLLRAYGA